MLRITLGFLYLIIFGNRLIGQTPAIYHIGLEEGIPERHVYSVAKGKDEFIWVGFKNQVCLFDGSRFFKLDYFLSQPFTLKGKDFSVLVQPNSSTVFIVSSEYIYELKPSKLIRGKLDIEVVSQISNIPYHSRFYDHNRFLYFFRKNQYSRFDIIKREMQFGNRQGVGELLFGKDFNLYLLNHNNIYKLNEKNEFVSILKSKHGGIEFSTIGGSFIDYFSLNNKPILMLQSAIPLHILYHNGKPAVNKKEIKFYFKGSYCIGSNGTFYFAHPWGLFKLNFSSGNFKNLSDNINARVIFIDTVQQRKFIANSNTVFVYNEQDKLFKELYFDSLIIKNLFSVERKLFVLPEGGPSKIVIINLDNLSSTKVSASFIQDFSSSVLLPDSSIYIFSDKVYKYHAHFNVIDTIQENKVFPCYRANLLTKDIVLLFSTAGVHLWNKVTQKFKLLVAGSFKDGKMVRNNLVLLHENGQIYEFNKVFDLIGIHENLSNLCNNAYELIWDANSNTLLVGTDKGLAIIDSKNFNPIRIFEKRDGLSFSESNSLASTIIGGKIYIGGLEGCSYFSAKFLRKPFFNRPVILEILNSSGILDYRLVSLLDQKVDLDNNQNNLRLFWPNLNFGSDFYKYHSSNQTEDKVLSTTIPLTLYNLSSGNFSLFFSSLLNKSSDSFSMNFYIKPSWYFSYWAIAIWIVLILFIVYILFYFRTRKLEIQTLQNLENSRQQLYQVIAHDISTPINNLQRVTQTLTFIIKEKREKDLRLILNELDKSAKAANLLLFNLMNLPKNQATAQMIQRYPIKESYLKISQAYQLISDTRILQFEYDFEGKEFVTIHVQSWEVLLRNTIDNCIKHASTYVKVSLFISRDGKSILMKIENDFEPNKYEKLVQVKAAIDQERVFDTGELSSGLGNILISKAMRDLKAKAKMNLFSSYYKTTVLIKL